MRLRWRFRELAYARQPRRNLSSAYGSNMADGLLVCSVYYLVQLEMQALKHIASHSWDDSILLKISFHGKVSRKNCKRYKIKKWIKRNIQCCQHYDLHGSFRL